MDSGETFEVKDIKLAEQGKKNIEWAASQMGALLKVKERFEKEKPLAGVRVGLALHITKETAMLVKTLIAGGAEVAITGCNPLSTQDDVAAALALEGVHTYGYKGETTEDYYRYLNKIIEFRPHVTIDDGCDLVTEIHNKHPDMIKDVWGGCEETTTGIIRLKAMEKDNALKYPVIAVNDNKTKHLTDNYYGTGQSTMDGIMRASNVLIAGSNLVVCGYGSCGKGVALRAQGFGANVIVTEVDPFRALQAVFDGYRVMPMSEAVKMGNIFITVTGNKGVIRTEHMKEMPDNSLIANAGHFDVEIDLKGLKKASTNHRNIRPFLDEYTLDGKRIYIGADGRLINLAAAEGHPSTIMSMSFCGQAMAVEYIVKNKGKLEPKVIKLSDEIDNEISKLQLEAMNIKMDKMTAEQEKYMSSWQEGT
ncbi:MAG: adenosylhomocysteinase [Candidatus Aenigmatarchaeota archaeon]|nr:adenosylhomocysteinase [Nanoarchaeota archaeon]